MLGHEAQPSPLPDDIDYDVEMFLYAKEMNEIGGAWEVVKAMHTGQIEAHSFEYQQELMKKHSLIFEDLDEYLQPIDPYLVTSKSFTTGFVMAHDVVRSIHGNDELTSFPKMIEMVDHAVRMRPFWIVHTFQRNNVCFRILFRSTAVKVLRLWVNHRERCCLNGRAIYTMRTKSICSQFTSSALVQ